MYQKCPNCNGSGVENSHLSIGKFPVNIQKNVCSVCNGAKIIDSVTGLPPQQVVQLTPKAYQEHRDTIGKQFNTDIEK